MTKPIEETSATSLLRNHYPALDGFRGLAVLMVFLIHFGSMVLPYSWLSFGWVGVDFFFVLSGFLITGGLVDTLGSPGALKRFYIKRVLRIFPLYYALWIIVFLLHWPLNLIQFQPRLWHWPIYLGNLVSPRHAASLWSISTLTLTRLPHWQFEILHFWSLCVEEQFYMVWPLTLLILRDKNLRMAACVLGVTASLASRIFFWHFDPIGIAQNEWAYHQTATHIDGLLIGSFIAMLIRNAEISRIAILRLNAALLIGPGLIITWYTVRCWRIATINHEQLSANLGSHWTAVPALTIIPLFATGILLSCLRDNHPISRVLMFRPLQALGEISYGFYIIHDLPQLILARAYPRLRTWHVANLAVIAWFFIAYGLAWLSFRYFETPFLRLKNRFGLHTVPFPRNQSSAAISDSTRRLPGEKLSQSTYDAE
jgi:peptidoglycan/LPS O-acetylase OafA/YrhL